MQNFARENFDKSTGNYQIRQNFPPSNFCTIQQLYVQQAKFTTHKQWVIITSYKSSWMCYTTNQQPISIVVLILKCHTVLLHVLSLQAILTVNILISVFGVVSVFSPNYYVLLLLRGIVGFGIGGGILSYVINCGIGMWYGTTSFSIIYCAGFIPKRQKAIVLFIINYERLVFHLMTTL